MTPRANPTNPAVTRQADTVVAPIIDKTVRQMADRLEPTLPGIREGTARSITRISHWLDGPLGHFHELLHIRQGSRFHEIFVNTNRARDRFGRAQPGRGVIITIAHELAHLYAAETNVKDTDPGGQVHNVEFARLADLSGCRVVKADGGYVTPDLSRRGLALFADFIPEMQQAFVRHASAISSPQANQSQLVTNPGKRADVALVPVKSPPIPGYSVTTRIPSAVVVGAEQVQIRGLLAALEDDIRHRLTTRAIENVALLAALEAHYLVIAPLAAANIQTLINNYTASAIDAIRKVRS